MTKAVNLDALPELVAAAKKVDVALPNILTHLAATRTNRRHQQHE